MTKDSKPPNYKSTEKIMLGVILMAVLYFGMRILPVLLGGKSNG